MHVSIPSAIKHLSEARSVSFPTCQQLLSQDYCHPTITIFLVMYCCCCFPSLQLHLWCSIPYFLPGKPAGVILCKVHIAKKCCVTFAASALLNRLEHLSNQFGRRIWNWKLWESGVITHSYLMGRCGRCCFRYLFPFYQHFPMFKAKVR